MRSATKRTFAAALATPLDGAADEGASGVRSGYSGPPGAAVALPEATVGPPSASATPRCSVPRTKPAQNALFLATELSRDLAEEVDVGAPKAPNKAVSAAEERDKSRVCPLRGLVQDLLCTRPQTGLII